MMKRILFLVVVVFLVSCATTNQPFYSDDSLGWELLKPTDGKKLVHSLFLVGDAGELDDIETGENFVISAVDKMIAGSGKETSLVYLGDNVYPYGLPKKEDPSREISEKTLNAHLNVAKSFDGKTYFIPGNHDWNKHKKGGLKAVKRQEKYVENYFQDDEKKIKFYPSDGCGDPKVHKVNSDLVFVFLDSQWWLHDWSKENEINQGCDVKSKGDLLKSIQEIFVDHKNDEIVVLMHHPIKSNGVHGGKFSWKHHLFPMHELGYWIPLPIIGSLYPIYRNVTGSTQDITNAQNQELMQEIDKMAKALRIHVVFAAGHEHGLQYFDGDKTKYIVSGSGSKVDYLKKGGEAEFLSKNRGFVKIDFYEEFEAWAEYYTVDGPDSDAKLAFKTKLREPRPGTVDEQINYPPITTQDTTIAANEKFAAGPLKELFLGKQYRDMWATPVSATVIDLEKAKGGLTPIKKGGGMASNSLRMEKEDGKQYILRSIKKDYTKLVPPGFGNLALIDILADQNSASHPYSALIIPELSKAAGVYYTDPKLVYLKHQRGLGNYNSQFPEELYLLEERPSGDWKDAEQFGNSAEIIGYTDLLENLRTKKHHFVDQEWVLKSRLFDLFIHDWDRHDDQWRWASFEEGENTIYRPIPRDRDQAFYKFIGIIPRTIAGLVMGKFKTMKDDVKDVKSLSFNAKHFDRYFLHDLEWSEWETVIAELQKNITDESIEKSMTHLPDQVENLNDQELIRKLKSRRDKLHKIGRRLYDFLSKEVEISATDDDEDFIVTRLEDGSVNVKMFTKEKGDDLLKYERTFYPSETREIRLYGLRGKDDLELKGDDNNDIRIRFIGGEDKDEVSNLTKSELFAYDDMKGIKFKKGNVIDQRSNDLEVNDYDRNGFKYDTNVPAFFFGSTVDDGFWFGGGLTYIKQGWRKDPFKAKHSFSFKVAPQSQNAFLIGYGGHFPNVVEGADFVPTISVDFPRYENFFGLGNDSPAPGNDIQFNWVRMQSIIVNPLLRTNVGGIELDFGPVFESHDIDNVTGRIGEDPVLGFTNEELKRRNYLGFSLASSLSYQDNAAFPTNGFNFNLSYKFLRDASEEENVTNFNTSLGFYVTLLNKPSFIFGTKLGYAKTFGDPLFHQLTDLGNNTNLRGYRNNRYRGDSGFYQNFDLRMKLFSWNSKVIPMDIGILGGYDYGRVWLESEQSDDWHSSTTVGMWFNILGAIVVHPYYSFTEEETETDVFTLRVGFNF
jgi:hypothetical protein